MFEYKGRIKEAQKEHLLSIMHTLSEKELETVSDDWWNIWGRPQQTPYLDNNDYRMWLFLGGRGIGKTRAGVGGCVWEMMHSKSPLRISVVAPTSSDIVGTIIAGDSGFMEKSPKCFYPRWDKTHNTLSYPGGHLVRCFSSEAPERLRGVNSDMAWLDEVAAYNGIEMGNIEAIKQVLLSTRLGKRTKIIVTTTPKNIPWLRGKLDESKDPANKIIVTTGSSYDNKANLSEDFFANIGDDGSLWARQEIYGEIVQLSGQQPIQKDWFRIWPPSKNLPAFQMVVASFDTAFTRNEINDPTAMICLGIFWDSVVNDWSGMILDYWIDWLTYPDLKAKCKQVSRTRYGVSGMNRGKKPECLLIENRASGQALIPDLANEDIPVAAAQPDKDKGQRLSEISSVVEDGRIWVMGDSNGDIAKWILPFILNVVNYPAVELDDDIDAFSQVVKFLKTSKWLEFSGRYRERPDPYSKNYSESTIKGNPYAQ